MTTLFPFLAAIAIYLATPILNAHAKATIARWLAEASRDATTPESSAPDYLSPKHIYDYIDFAADHAQVLPAVVLTSIGVVLALPEDVAPTTAATFVLGTVLIVLVTQVRVLSASPQQYAAMKRFGYSFVALVGIAINTVAVVLVLLMVY